MGRRHSRKLAESDGQAAEQKSSCLQAFALANQTVLHKPLQLEFGANGRLNLQGYPLSGHSSPVAGTKMIS